MYPRQSAALKFPTNRTGSGHERKVLKAVPSASDFSVSGPFNEMVVMGVLAVRLQVLNKVLYWDGPNMNFTNISDTG